MSRVDHESIIEGRLSKYESSFFHIYLDGESPISNRGFQQVSERDYASFVHEYIHYIQHITTPYGLKYNSYFTYSLLLLREFIDSNNTISTPVKLEEVIQARKQFESELKDKNGCRNFSKGTVSDIEIKADDVLDAKVNDTAVNIGVYDFENHRVFEKGFGFGYWCVIESMAHLVQSLINPELFHSEVPYRAAQLICNKIRPDLKDDKKLLISICYTSLFFNNPGHAFFDILKSAKKDENGLLLFQSYMRDYSRVFQGQQMPNYRMMHLLMDKFLNHLDALLGNDSVYMKEVIENLKYESSSGNSLLLELLYNVDLSKSENLNKLIAFYGRPAIDSKNQDVVIPFNNNANVYYAETSALLSLELILARLKSEAPDTTCIRYPICDRVTKENGMQLIDENCAGTQWQKQLSCIFTVGLSYWRMSNKNFD